jgi:hypothetical protein
MHIRDFVDLQPAPKQTGKRTQTFSANLVKAGSILPYYMDGRIVWMWKDPTHWYTADMRDQFENLVICRGHQSPEWSHESPIGMVRDVSLMDPYINGTCSVFDQSGLQQIYDGMNQLSPDAVIKMVPVGREINGQWVDFAQESPVLDHIAAVAAGRQGAELTMVLQSMKDHGETLDSIALELTLAQAQHTIRLSDQIDTNAPTMKTAEELTIELTATVTQLGEATQQAVQMRDERDATAAQLVEANATIATLQASDAAGDATTIATEGMALFNAATTLGLTVTMIDCIKTPLVVYRQIKDTLAPQSMTVSDEMLPVFCAGMLASRTPATTTAAAPIADAAPATSAEPATFSLADALQAGTQTSNVALVQPPAGAAAKTAFKLPNPLAGIKAPSLVL